jgi:hypothetical protein
MLKALSRFLIKMPGFDLFKNEQTAPAPSVVELPPQAAPAPEPAQIQDPKIEVNGTEISSNGIPPAPPQSDWYSNARLDPKNFLEGELSHNPATRLRQLLARPGIVVAPGICDGISARCAIEAGFSCMYQR